MRGFITRLFGDPNQREIKKLQPIVEKINRLDEQTKALSDEALRQKTTEFKERFRQAVAAAQQRVEEIKARLPENPDGYERRELQEAQQQLFQAEQAALWELLPEAYAVVREASWRVLRMRHFDVQLLGGIVLHLGRIAEKKSGKG